MNKFLYSLKSEALKFLYSKTCRIVFVIVVIVQALLSYVSAEQTLSIGLTATPETNPDLLEPMPPLEYMGFAEIIGTIPMIVLGGIFGAAEFKRHCLRTTMLSSGDKNIVFISKTLVLTFFSFVISFISVFVSVFITHTVFGSQGLDPIKLTPFVWKLIALATCSITFLTLISYLIGFLFHSAVVPLMFLIIQAYNFGNLLAEHFDICKFLPVSLVNGLIATSRDMLTDKPFVNIISLTVWSGIIGICAYIRFRKSDLKGVY